MTAIVTGTAGAVGVHVAGRLLSDGHEMHAGPGMPPAHDAVLGARRQDMRCAPAFARIVGRVDGMSEKAGPASGGSIAPASRGRIPTTAVHQPMGRLALVETMKQALGQPTRRLALPLPQGDRANPLADPAPFQIRAGIKAHIAPETGPRPSADQDGDWNRHG